MKELLDPQKNFMAAKYLYDKFGLKPWNASSSKWGEGRKVLGYLKGRPVYDAGNGQWEVM